MHGARGPLFTACLLFFPAAAHATVLLDWDLGELAARADSIAVGQLVSQKFVKTAAGVMTESKFRVEETLHGRGERELVISQLGGTIEGVTTHIDGDAKLLRGRRMLLFTYRHPDGRRYLVGMAQGAFLVDGDRLLQRLEAPRISAQRELIAPGVRERTLTGLRALLKGARPR